MTRNESPHSGLPGVNKLGYSAMTGHDHESGAFNGNF
jgi:hypothetical protein